MRRLPVVPSLLDPAFKYTNAEHTDIRKTFARVRREIAQTKASASRDKPTAKVAR